MTHAEETPKKTLPDVSNAGDEDLPPLTFLQMLSSTLAAALGVQSEANRERDFARGKASHFILMGIGFTAVFVVIMVLLVKLVISQLT